IIDAGLGWIVWVGEPHGACDQKRTLRQRPRNLRKGVRLARQKKWKRRFRPDQIRERQRYWRYLRCHAVEPWARRQSDIAIHHFLPCGVIESDVLLQVRLHDPQMHAVDEPSRRVRESRCAKTGKDRNRQNRQREWQPWPTRAARIVGYRSRTG